MSDAWKIAGPGASITVRILTRENPDTKNVYRANWLTCELELDIQPFTGRFKTSFTTQEFFKFWTGLRMMLSSLQGDAVFGSGDEALQVTIRIEKTGRALVTATTRVHAQSKTTVSFSFETDQTHLGETGKELEAVISQYPIIV